MKEIYFTKHAIDQLEDRGATKKEIEAAIRYGEFVEVKHGRIAYRKNFAFDAKWKGKTYRIKQVMPIVVEEAERIVVITVYVFYFGGE